MRTTMARTSRNWPPRAVNKTYSRGIFWSERPDSILSVTLQFLPNSFAWRPQIGNHGDARPAVARLHDCRFADAMAIRKAKRLMSLLGLRHSAIDYCFGCAPVAGLVADPLGRNPSVIRERMAWISVRSSGMDELGCLSELAGAVEEVFLSAAIDEPPAGVVDELPAGKLPIGAGGVAGVLSFGVVPPSAGFGPGPGDAGESTLPRMIGRPSLPLPMITIFVFVDCASASVASMPRQRRYESEIPWLTVCWKAAMPFASICLRFDSCASRSTRNLNS